MLQSAKKACTCLAVCTALATPAAYAAHFPTRAELQYTGPSGVPATMTFSRNSSHYSIVTTIDIPFYSMRFSSTGNISGNNLIPKVYDDDRQGKNYAHADFDYNIIRYGKTGEAVQSATVNGPVFDLFTLAWQLAMNNARLPANAHITNGKKIYTVEGIRKTGRSRYALGNGVIPINHYRVQRGDNTIDYAFAPSLSDIPAQITYTDDGKSYTLKLKSARLDGKIIQIP